MAWPRQHIPRVLKIEREAFKKGFWSGVVVGGACVLFLVWIAIRR